MRIHALRVILSCCPVTLSGCLPFDPTPPTLDFGEIVIGSESGNMAARWTNSAATRQVIDGITVSGQFREVSGPGLDHRVPAGATSGPYNIRFRPTREGAVTERAVPYGFFGMEVGVDARLVGSGVLPVVPEGGYLASVAPAVPATADIDFGSVVVKQAGYRTLTLRNTGPSDRLLVIQLDGGGSAFSAAATATMTSPIQSINVPGNSRVTIVLRFVPPAEGTFTDAAHLRSGSTARIGSDHMVIRLAGRGHKG
jgi:hypothetical protein